MKKLFKPVFMAALLSVCSIALHAQSDKATKPYIVHTMYLTGAMSNMRVNLDSLLKVYKKEILDPNSFFTSSKIVMHWWGHDSREVILISELNSWDDIPKAFDKQRELQMQMMKQPDGKEFAKQWMALFMPEHHSDEIYQVVAE